MLKRLSGEQWIALGIIFIGLVMAWQITGITKSTGYAGVGPRFFPSLIVVGLILAGGGLFWQYRPSHQDTLALTQTDNTADSDAPPAPLNWYSFAIASAALIAHMILIGYIGFTLAGAILCFGICLALETKRPVIDLVLSFLLSFGLFHLFKWLGLNLPSLIFGGII